MRGKGVQTIMKTARTDKIIAATALWIAIGSGIAVARAQQPAAGDSSYATPESPAASAPQEIPITFPRQISAEVFNGDVVRVVDGATLVVERDSKTDHSRPETIHLFGLLRASAGSEPKAVAYLNDNLKGNSVRVEGRRRRPDGSLEAVVTEMPKRAKGVLQARRTDSSGITPMVMPGTAANTGAPSGSTPPLNFSLVRLGLARYDTSIVAKDRYLAGRLAEAEASARTDRNGLWADASAGSSTGSATSAVLPGNTGKK